MENHRQIVDCDNAALILHHAAGLQFRRNSIFALLQNEIKMKKKEKKTAAEERHRLRAPAWI